MTRPLRVAIVGGGVVGLAHAWSALERGYRVTLFERGPRASGASVRNFGMIWPIGQPAGELHQIALRSRERWLRLAQAAGVWANPCGSIHLAHRADELAVLREFHDRAPALGFDCTWLSPSEVHARSPGVQPQGLLGGLFSPTELCVRPRAVIPRFTQWLEQSGVACEFGTAITQVETGRLRSADGRQWDADRIVICSGADLELLFPEVLRESGLRLCKLQMLKTAPVPGNWQLGPHLASGLTLRHYRNFEVCPSLAELQRRIARETPELDRYGIHVMASQNDTGEITLGDSHEYDAEIEPFDKVLIDELMLRELRKIIRLPDWTIAERWNGIYAKHPSQAWFEAECLPQVHVFTGLGGAGMTMSLGAAEHFWMGRGEAVS